MIFRLDYKKCYFITIGSRILILFFVSINAFFANAQQQLMAFQKANEEKFPGINIIGKIVDSETKVPLEFSTITMYSKSDSTMLFGTISNSKGTFSIKTTYHSFYIKIDFIAYQSVIIDSFEVQKNQTLFDLGTIEMQPSIEIMAEIEVRAEKSSVIMTLDKRIFFVGNDITSTGGTAEDVLRNVPGIAVGMDGWFSLRGNDNIRILLNGRASSLVSHENQAGLRQIRASQIERVEVITNPSARYEAAGMAGIVNIILKKNQARGLNGSFNMHYGNYNNAGLGADINYHKNKINAFIGFGGWHTNRPGLGSFENKFFNLDRPDSTVFSTMNRTHQRSSLPGFLKSGLDIHFNPKNSLISSVYYRKSNGKNTSSIQYQDAIGTPDNIDLTTERLEEETEEEQDVLYSLIYKKLFAPKGHQLIADLRYEDKTKEEFSVYNENYFDDTGSPLLNQDYQQLSSNQEGNRTLNINIDYILPLEKKDKFEAGLQGAFREIFNNYQIQEIINAIENPTGNFANDFLYQEKIQAAYLNFGKSIGRFSLQTGLRMEHSDVTTKLLATNEHNPRQYTNVFPSLFLTYNLSPNKALQVSYSRRIQRPTFSDLNPFFTIRDRRNIFRGNPNIEPEYTDSYELGYVNYLEKGSLSSIAYFRKTNNVIKRLQRLDEAFPQVTITQAENLALKRNYGIEFTYTYTPSPIWRLNGDFNFFHSLSEGSFRYNGKTYFVGGASFSMTAKASSRVTLWKKVHTQLMLSYIAPRTTTQGRNRSMTSLDFATGVDMFKKKATLTLSINDVLNSRRRRSFSEAPTFFSEDNFLWQSRSIVLSFHYLFNQQKEENRIYINPLGRGEEEEF